MPASARATRAFLPPEKELPDLSGTRLGKLAHKIDVMGDLERGQILFAMHEDLSDIRGFVPPGHDKGRDPFAQDLVRKTCHGRFHHPRDGCEHLLYLFRAYPVGAALDHLALSARDEDESVRVHCRKVPCMEPAVPEDPGRLFRVLPVALHHVFPACDDLSRLPWPNLATPLVHDPEFHAGDGLSDRTRLFKQHRWIQIGKPCRGLGLAVHDVDVGARKRLLEPPGMDGRHGPPAWVM